MALVLRIRLLPLDFITEVSLESFSPAAPDGKASARAPFPALYILLE